MNRAVKIPFSSWIKRGINWRAYRLPPPWHHHGLCGVLLPVGPDSHTTTGHWLANKEKSHSASHSCIHIIISVLLHVLDHSILIIIDPIVTVPLLSRPNSLWKTPTRWACPPAAWVLTAAWKASPHTAGPPGLIWNDANSYTPENTHNALNNMQHIQLS